MNNDGQNQPVMPGNQLPTSAPSLPAEPQPPAEKPKRKISKKTSSTLVLVVLLAAAGVSWWLFINHNTKPTKYESVATASPALPSPPSTKVQGLQLDATKNYGNKYANGILPVGDNKYTTASAKQGYIDACSDYAKNLAVSSGGAMNRGPWFMDNNTEYDTNKKVHVRGKVKWTGSFSNTVSGTTRTILSNDLPLTDFTGTFPISSQDPAYVYDRNPNTINAQSFTYSLNADPTYSATPNCEGGQVGVMLTGVALFNALDAGGRDAGAWETQDDCDGHPQEQGVYHYHTLSSCIKNVSVHTVIGFALDGFPITGPQVGTNNYLTTTDLDECHGITSQLVLDGKNVTMYHYVMTEDFPYSVSCYRGEAIQPPGQQVQQEAQQQGQIPNRRLNGPPPHNL